eukprot:gene3249-3527_t
MALFVATVAKPGSSPAPDSDDRATSRKGSPGPQDQSSFSAEPTRSEAAASPIPADVPSDGSSTFDGAHSGSVPTTPSVGAASGGGGGGGVQGSPSAAVSSGGSAGGQSAVALLTRFNGIGYTFVLAGFLKIVTLGGLASSAPVDMARTTLGKASPYLMVPVGLGLYAPDGEWVRRPRPRLPGRMSELRAQLGDRDLLGGVGSVSDSRTYQVEKPGRELYDDLAWCRIQLPVMAVENVHDMFDCYAEDEYASAVDDILRARGAMGADAAGGGEGRPLQARPAAARRSFLSDNQR